MEGIVYHIASKAVLIAGLAIVIGLAALAIVFCVNQIWKLICTGKNIPLAREIYHIAKTQEKLKKAERTGTE